MESSAGVSLEAMLVAMAALSLISDPVSVEVVAVFAEVAFVAVGADEVEEVSAPLNHEDTWENGFAVPALPVVATEVPDPCLL